MNNQDANGQYIWLRYAMQYSKDDRTHTIEMGIPVPLGASAEQREELLREAETGMNQLVQHVEQRVSQAVGSVQTTRTTNNRDMLVSPPLNPATKATSATASTSATSASSNAQPTAPQSVANQTTPVQARPVPANRPASVPAPQTATQSPSPNNTNPAPPAGQEVDVPPNRSHIGASMPASLSPNSMGGNLQIPEFVSYINENMHLKPRQAMEILGVKSLSGINLRDALEHLKRIMAQNASNGQVGTSMPPQSPPQQGPQNQQAMTVREARPVVSPVSQPPSPMRQNAPISIDEQSTRPALDEIEQTHESNIIEMRVPRQVPPARGFDEEIDEDDVLEDLEELDNFSQPSEFSAEQLGQARDKISSLREMQGAAVASAARLQALRNAADAEVSDEQLLELVIGIWNIQAMKKLKVDQAEALISWAKQDYFLEEVDAVLAVLEEERYARGNR
jgi:hypothetical protein